MPKIKILKTCPLSFVMCAMAHMTNDSGHVLDSRASWWNMALTLLSRNRWRKGDEMVATVVHQARMMYHFDHRYNSVKV